MSKKLRCLVGVHKYKNLGTQSVTGSIVNDDGSRIMRGVYVYIMHESEICQLFY